MCLEGRVSGAPPAAWAKSPAQHFPLQPAPSRPRRHTEWWKCWVRGMTAPLRMLEARNASRKAVVAPRDILGALLLPPSSLSSLSSLPFLLSLLSLLSLLPLHSDAPSRLLPSRPHRRNRGHSGIGPLLRFPSLRQAQLAPSWPAPTLSPSPPARATIPALCLLLSAPAHLPRRVPGRHRVPGVTLLL